MFAELLATIAAVPLAVYLLDGVTAASIESSLIAGAVLAGLYLLLRPLAKLLTKPLGCLTLGLAGIIVDTGMVLLCTGYFPQYLQVDGLLWAAGTALLVNVCRGAARMLFPKD